MNLRLVVLIKQVPDIEKGRFDFEKGRIDRDSAEAEINPFDLHALEAAVRIKEEVGGHVIVVSMGPAKAESSLRDALSRGADEALLLEDKKFAGADTLATSYTLACAIRKIGKFDMVLCGEKTVDGDTGQVGPEVSEFLNVPLMPYVSEIVELSEETIVAVSDMEDFLFVSKANLPVLITVTRNLNKPRLPTLKDKIRVKNCEIETWNVEKMSELLDPNMVGFEGSATRVCKIVVPPERASRAKIVENSSDATDEIVNLLVAEGLL
jgi:electron transfer flavoprotein beta subunit